VPSIIDSRGETEGMPTVVIEAMAAGVPVVGSAVDGIPDIIRHGENGWLCREKDPEHLAETILAALDQSDDQRIRRAAAQTAEQHDWPRVAERYMEVFERLVPMRGAAA
jgi:glycosyltransferase involved in cell wall biosynthesis